MQTKLVKAPHELALDTSLKGYVNTTYTDLVLLFGQPELTDGDGKVRVCWTLTAEGEEVPITIYDWKERCPVAQVRDWHIGGKSRLAVQLLQQVLPHATFAR